MWCLTWRLNVQRVRVATGRFTIDSRPGHTPVCSRERPTAPACTGRFGRHTGEVMWALTNLGELGNISAMRFTAALTAAGATTLPPPAATKTKTSAPSSNSTCAGPSWYHLLLGNAPCASAPWLPLLLLAPAVRGMLPNGGARPGFTGSPVAGDGRTHVVTQSVRGGQ